MVPQELLDSVLQLPEADRLLVARRLLETLPDDISTGEIDEDEFTAELERRSGDWNGSIPWTTLRAELQNKK